MFTITTIRFKIEGDSLVFANTESNGLYPYDNAVDEIKRVHQDAKSGDRLDHNIETLNKLKNYDRKTIEVISSDNTKQWFMYINKIS